MMDSTKFQKLPHHRRSGTLYEDNPESYAYGLSFYKLAWLFVLGSVMGCLAETLWYLYLRGHLMSRRGVLIGPFSPIYGVMMVLVTLLLYRVRRKNGWILYFSSMALGTGFEYMCSWLMEHVLGTKSWSYVNKAFNLNGRVCLQMSILWGVVGFLYIRLVYPLISRTIENFKPKFGKIVGTVLCIFLLLDCFFSLGVSLRQTGRREGRAPRNSIEKWIDRVYTDEVLKEIYTEIRVVKK